MIKKIVATGRGGSGKSTFIALATKFLDSPPLLIDLDPDQNLAEMVGLDLEKEKIKTISDVLYDVQKDKTSEELTSMPLPNKIEYLLHYSCLYESKYFDIISLGVKWTKGCYCVPNNILREIIPEIASNYTYTLIDSPAGLEHLNRKVVSDVDDTFIILDPSKKALKEVERISELAKILNINVKNFYTIGNFRFNENIEKYFQDKYRNYLGGIVFDVNVENYNMQGKSLLKLPQDSPAGLSVKKILKKAGYETK